MSNDSFTSVIVLGILSASMFCVLKKHSLACTIADSNAAIIVEVRIATSIEPDLSPTTTIGGSKGKLK